MTLSSVGNLRYFVGIFYCENCSYTFRNKCLQGEIFQHSLLLSEIGQIVGKNLIFKF